MHNATYVPTHCHGRAATIAAGPILTRGRTRAGVIVVIPCGCQWQAISCAKYSTPVLTLPTAEQIRRQCDIYILDSIEPSVLID